MHLFKSKMCINSVLGPFQTDISFCSVKITCIHVLGFEEVNMPCLGGRMHISNIFKKHVPLFYAQAVHFLMFRVIFFCENEALFRDLKNPSSPPHFQKMLRQTKILFFAILQGDTKKLHYYNFKVILLRQKMIFLTR